MAATLLTPSTSVPLPVGMTIMFGRETLRCGFCSLTQFRTHNDLCRRCHRAFKLEAPPTPQPEAEPVELLPGDTEDLNGLAHLKDAFRKMREERNLSQRGMAAIMSVPRTYISKIENGKAVPTLDSMFRIAAALGTSVSAILAEAGVSRRRVERSINGDPWLREFASLVRGLSPDERDLIEKCATNPALLRFTAETMMIVASASAVIN